MASAFRKIVLVFDLQLETARIFFRRFYEVEVAHDSNLPLALVIFGFGDLRSLWRCRALLAIILAKFHLVVIKDIVLGQVTSDDDGDKSVDS